MPLLANFHTHTTFCDGKSTAEEMVEQAISLGFTQLGFSGHMDHDIHMDIQAYFKEIRRLAELYSDRIEILCGVELDNMFDPGCAEGADYIIGSTHFLDVQSEIPMSVDNTEKYMACLANEFFGGDYYDLAKAYYDLEAQIFDRTRCDLVGHFDLVTRFNDEMHFLDESEPRYWIPALTAMEHLVRQGVPFEINCGAVNRNRKRELYPNRFLLRHLRKFGGEIFINSDAHQRELLDGGFDIAVKTAIECGFTHVNIFTKEGNGLLHTKQLALDTL